VPYDIERCMNKTAAGSTTLPARLASYLVAHGVDKAAADKVAAGITVYLLEELGDARLRCAQLKKYVKEATDLIEKSPQRDHFFEVAAHLIHGIPDALFKMEKALDASALAAARLDYEEIKDTLKPEKADELEDALQDVRLRYLKRRSSEWAGTEPTVGVRRLVEGEPKDMSEGTDVGAAKTAGGDTPISTGKGTPMMTPKQAAEQFLALAAQTEGTGKVPMNRVVALLGALEGNTKRASVPAAKAAAVFREVAAGLLNPQEGKAPSRLALANMLRNVIADQIQPMQQQSQQQMQQVGAQVAAAIYQQASSREDVMKGFKDANPAMTDAQLEEAADHWEKNKDVVKNQHK
jgi:hypothetical protein